MGAALGSGHHAALLRRAQAQSAGTTPSSITSASRCGQGGTPSANTRSARAAPPRTKIAQSAVKIPPRRPTRLAQRGQAEHRPRAASEDGNQAGEADGEDEHASMTRGGAGWMQPPSCPGVCEACPERRAREETQAWIGRESSRKCSAPGQRPGGARRFPGARAQGVTQGGGLGGGLSELLAGALDLPPGLRERLDAESREAAALPGA